jgi:hypothetical protein
MPMGGTMAMMVSKPKSLEDLSHTKMSLVIKSDIEKIVEPEPKCDVYDFVRAKALQDYNRQRVDDRDQYNAWLQAYTAFNDTPELYRKQKNSVNGKKKVTHINKVYATWLEDGDSWGNTNSPTRNKALEQTKNSEASRVHQVSHSVPVVSTSWKPQIVTEGFEFLGRPPSMAEVLAYTWRKNTDVPTSIVSHGSTTSVDINTSGVYEDEETSLVYEPDETWTYVEKLEAHINLCKEISFLKKLSSRSDEELDFPIERMLHKKFMAQAVHLGHDLKSSWKKFMSSNRYRQYEVRQANYLVGNELTAYINKHLGMGVPYTFPEDINISLSKVDRPLYVHPNGCELSISREKRVLKNMQYNRISVNRLRFDLHKWMFHQTIEVRSLDSRSLWERYHSATRRAKKSMYLSESYGTPIEQTQTHRDEKQPERCQPLTASGESTSWLFWEGCDNSTYSKWLFDHDKRNQWLRDTWAPCHEELVRLKILRAFSARMFFESIPSVSYQTETYIYREHYWKLQDEQRYQHYWDMVVPYQASVDDDVYTDWLFNNTSTGMTKYSDENVQLQETDAVKSIKYWDYMYAMKKCSKEAHTRATNRALGKFPKPFVPKTNKREVVKSNSKMMFFDARNIDADFKSDPKSGLLLPITSGLYVEHDKTTGLYLPMGSHPLIRPNHKRQLSTMDKVVEFFKSR